MFQGTLRDASDPNSINIVSLEQFRVENKYGLRIAYPKKG